MDNEEKFEIPREPDETHRAWKAKRDYLAMGPGRSLEKLLAQYLARIENGTGMPPSRHKATLGLWSRKHRWVEVSQEFDIFQGERQFEEQLKQRRAEYTEQLKEFQRHHLGLGKAGFQASAEALKDILEFLDTHPTIQTWAEAHHAVCLIKGLVNVSSFWGQALAVDSMLRKLDLEDLG